MWPGSFFQGGTPLSSLVVGSAVRIKENDALVDYLVVHQGLPGSEYDASCDGCWLLRKDCIVNRNYGSNDVYETSGLHSYVNGAVLSMYSATVKNAIKNVKIPYRKSGGADGWNLSGADGLQCKVFVLSPHELGFTTSDSSFIPVNGRRLEYFTSGTGTAANNKRKASLNGTAVAWWTRSMNTYFNSRPIIVESHGGVNVNRGASDSCGVRPAFILPSDFTVEELAL